MYIKRILLTLLLLLFTLITTGCMPKGADGKYHSKYSYHPYYKLYKDKMAGGGKRYKTKYSYHYSNDNHSKKIHPTRYSYKKIAQRVKHRVKYNDEDLYPSNVPASSNY